MNLAGKRNRQWWIPSLVILVAILALGLFLPGLLNPAQVPAGGIPPEKTRTPRLTATDTRPVSLSISPSPPGTQASTATPMGPSPTNCTYSMYYWIDHPQAWMTENVVIGTLTYTKGEAILILQTESDDAKTLLLQQFFTALLNSLRADPTAVTASLSAASKWLEKHTPGEQVSPADRQEALSLMQVLLDYNTGILGPGHCADEPSTPTPVPTATATPTETPTATPLRTLRPVFPTATRDTRVKPTDEPTAAPTPEPTQEPTQEPTNPPRPTNTPQPRPTPTPAPTEEPPTQPPPQTPNVFLILDLIDSLF
jgi:hypothetical protein